MKTPPFRICRLFLIFMLPVAAVTMVKADDLVPLNLSFARINLANGRVLKNATLTSVNRDSNLIYVLEERRLKPYPAALFPGFIATQIADRVQEYPTAKPKSPAANSNRATSTATDDAPRHPVGSPADHAARRAAIEEAVAAKAQRAALRHFRYGTRSGSGYTTMTNGEVDLDPPSPIPGWTHRYRVEGTVYFSTYDSVGSSFQNRRRGVEVIVEATSPHRVKVLEVTTDWSPSH